MGSIVVAIVGGILCLLIYLVWQYFLPLLVIGIICVTVYYLGWYFVLLLISPWLLVNSINAICLLFGYAAPFESVNLVLKPKSEQGHRSVIKAKRGKRLHLEKERQEKQRLRRKVRKERKKQENEELKALQAGDYSRWQDEHGMLTEQGKQRITDLEEIQRQKEQQQQLKEMEKQQEEQQRLHKQEIERQQERHNPDTFDAALRALEMEQGQEKKLEEERRRLKREEWKEVFLLPWHTMQRHEQNEHRRESAKIKALAEQLAEQIITNKKSKNKLF